MVCQCRWRVDLTGAVSWVSIAVALENVSAAVAQTFACDPDMLLLAVMIGCPVSPLLFPSQARSRKYSLGSADGWCLQMQNCVPAWKVSMDLCLTGCNGAVQVCMNIGQLWVQDQFLKASAGETGQPTPPIGMADRDAHLTGATQTPPRNAIRSCDLQLSMRSRSIRQTKTFAAPCGYHCWALTCRRQLVLVPPPWQCYPQQQHARESR
jgi:hypothetical protein